MDITDNYITDILTDAIYYEYVDGANEKGILIASNVYEAGTVASTFKMEEAYVMGKNV